MKTDVKNTQPSESRKIRKPLMEKKRRARINDSLETLKRILLESKTTLKESMRKNGQRTAKLEKADILEMTVSYLQHLHTKLNEIKEHDAKTNRNQIKDSCVALIPTKLSSGEVVYFLPSNLKRSQKTYIEKSSRPSENVWRPW